MLLFPTKQLKQDLCIMDTAIEDNKVPALQPGDQRSPLWLYHIFILMVRLQLKLQASKQYSLYSL